MTMLGLVFLVAAVTAGGLAFPGVYSVVSRSLSFVFLASSKALIGVAFLLIGVAWLALQAAAWIEEDVSND